MNRHFPSVPLALILMLVPWLAGAAQLPDFTGLVESSSPAVVSITTSSFDDRDNDTLSQEEVPELFRRFFDIPENPGNQQFSPERRSGGSGFVIDPDGYIVTNNHVIEGAEKILVRMGDKREFDAEIVGTDPQSDIALLKIDENNLHSLKLGDSEALKLGEWVLAIGAPFGFEQSVTAGIVSAKGRANGAQQYVPFIQTDVPINRGNSGGPLLNMDGEVVGVNSWILSSNGGFIGLSFSIPIEVVANTVSQLRSYGRVSRGLLGVGIEPVDREMARYLKMDRPQGALVNRVEDDSAADRAGITVGDVILVFEGQKIEEYSDLPPLVGALRPGAKTKLIINRDGQQKTINVVIGELPQPEAIQASLGDSGPDRSNALGIKVDSIAPGLRGQLGDPEGGVVVREVESEAAWRAGIRPGNVILRINQRKINDISDFQELAGDAESGETVALLTLQNGTPNFIAYTPESAEE